MKVYTDTEKFCIKGHLPTVRYVSNKKCIKCVSEYNKQLSALGYWIKKRKESK